MSGSQSIAIVVSLAVLAAVVTVISGAAFYYNRYHRSQAPADIERTLTESSSVGLVQSRTMESVTSSLSQSTLPLSGVDVLLLPAETARTNAMRELGFAEKTGVTRLFYINPELKAQDVSTNLSSEEPMLPTIKALKPVYGQYKDHIYKELGQVKNVFCHPDEPIPRILQNTNVGITTLKSKNWAREIQQIIAT